MKKFIIFLPLFLFLTACVSPPKGLEANDFTIQDIKKIEPDDYICQCKPVRLGGKILNATALNHQTKLEILSLPVSKFSAKPSLNSMSDGRFIAYVNGFLDPESVKEQFVTVTGTLQSKENGRIDLATYQYPVIRVKNYKLWQLVQEYYYEPADWDAYYWGWGYSRFDRFFWRPQARLRYRLY